VPGEVDEQDVVEEWLWSLRAEGEAEARARAEGVEVPLREWWAAREERRPERSVTRGRRGWPAHLHVPSGEKKALFDMVAKNAAESSCATV